MNDQFLTPNNDLSGETASGPLRILCKVITDWESKSYQYTHTVLLRHCIPQTNTRVFISTQTKPANFERMFFFFFRMNFQSWKRPMRPKVYPYFTNKGF